MTVTWPLASLFDAFRATFGTEKWQSGRSRAFGRLYGGALLRNVPPTHYARYAHVLADEKLDFADFLLPIDIRGLLNLSVQRGAVIADVQDKARFEQICTMNALPCVPTLSVFNAGDSTGVDALRSRKSPFFVKAVTGNRGAGAERWMPDGSEWLSSSGRKLAIDDIIAELRPQNCIVQPVLEDCAELRSLGTEALSSVRLVTAKGDSIAAQPIAASLSLATQAGSPISHHGIMCGLDISTGTVTRVKPTSEHHDARCDRLLGFVVPFWAQTVSLVCRAHQQAFPAFVTLGWDVALTQSGPILLETNVSWNMVPHQLRTGPLGKTALADVIDELIGPAETR